MMARLAAGIFTAALACAAPTEPVAQAASAAPAIADKTTPAASLAPANLSHTLLLQIDRDFGKSHFAIALDGWVDKSTPDAIADVRLWWLKTNKSGERGPFSKKSSKHFDVRTKVVTRDHWKVHLDTKASRFTFDVKLESGTMSAYATVVVAGQEISGCRAKRGKLRAKRLLGAAVGIDSLDVTCVSPGGKSVTGPMKASKR